MPAPIDYGVQVADPMQSFLSAFQTGATIREAGLKQEQQTQQQAQQKLIQEGFTKVRGPNATAADYANLQMLLPEAQAKAVREGFSMLSGERQNVALQQGGQVFSAFKAGKPEIAIQLMDQQIEGKRNAGDEAGAKFLETMRDVSKTDPKAGEIFFGNNLVQMPGGDKLIEAANKLSGEARTAAEAPAKLADLEAKALESGVKAEFARPVAVAELARIKAETLAPSVRESIDFANLQPEQQKIFQALQILKKPPAAVTNVNVSSVDKTAAAELGKLVPDLYNQANSAASQLSDLPRYQAALDAAITGPFAEQRLSTARISNALGFTGDKAVNATREVIQGLSEMALKSRTMLTGQGQITEGEQKLLLKARSGDIDFTKGELKTIFGVADRAAKAQYNQSRKLLESAAKQSPTAQMFLENMQPLATQEAPQPAPAQTAPAAAAPGMPAGFRVIQRGQ
tara:strand:+ start:415 stop:1782 length:1368 start_codon:yes stop_codon:yes gene_type:complete